MEILGSVAGYLLLFLLISYIHVETNALLYTKCYFVCNDLSSQHQMYLACFREPVFASPYANMPRLRFSSNDTQ